MAGANTHEFKAETRKVLNILSHSLYTHREIFLRELLSNAADALEKLRFLRNKGESIRYPELPLEIHIRTEKISSALIVEDSGLGMTGQELVDNLGTIARSGSESFAAGQDSGAQAELIGRFGVGFYSVFMVAERVELISTPALGEEGPHVWESDGIGGFALRPLEGEEAAERKRGTLIRIKLKQDAGEFLETGRLREIVRRHSNFLPFPIFLDGELLNTTPALWREAAFSIDRERYNEFYAYLGEGVDAGPPLEVIHINVDAPVQFSALLFIPNSPQDFPGARHEERGLDLYVRRVLIARGHSGLIPAYLGFLKGVADTEDLPLNISRESLQENVVLRKISQAIVKQVMGHLEKMAAERPEDYDAFWKLHGRYLKFAVDDYAQRERAAGLMRFVSSVSAGAEGGRLIGLDAYLERARPGQREIWHLVAPSIEAAGVSPYLDLFRRKGLEVLYLLEAADEFVLDALGKYKDHPFRSVEKLAAGELDAFADLEEASPSAGELGDEDRAALDKLLERMRAILGEEVAEIRLAPRLAGSPAALAAPEGMSSSMERLLRAMRKEEGLPRKALEINPDHRLTRLLLALYKRDPADALLPGLTRNILDSALLLDGYAQDAALMGDRSLKILESLLDRALPGAAVQGAEVKP